VNGQPSARPAAARAHVKDVRDADSRLRAGDSERAKARIARLIRSEDVM
jgi:hypothetical protein